MAVLGNRATGIMDYIERMGAQFLPANMSPAPDTPLQRAMNRPYTQMAQSGQGMITTQPSGQMSMASPVTPPRMISEMKIPDMGGSGVRMTPEMMKKAEAASKVVDRIKQQPELEQNPSFRKMASDFFGNRENMLRLALAFNTMRLQPDQGLASVIGSELKDIREQTRITAASNATLKALRDAGVPEKDLAVLAKDPAILKEYAKKYFAKQLGVLPAEQQAFEDLIKDMSPEDQEKARRIKAGLDPRAGSQFALSLEEVFARAAAQAGGGEKGKSEEKRKQEQVIKDRTWNMWTGAVQNLEKNLLGTTTGFFAGLLPAISDDQQLADQAIAQMAPTLKNIFREAGEGVFTDKDQELLLAMIPDRQTNPAVVAQAIKSINDIVRIKLNQPEPMPAINGVQPKILRFDKEGNPING